VQQLIDYCGACERIHGTPLPYPYMVHLRRALLLYCFTLPFALVREFGWITIFDTVMVTYIFFGIEEIGVEIEDPFGHDDNDLPLADFCRNIAHVLEELLTPDPEAVDAEPAASREPGTAALPAIPLE
jgi:putative membrane protein